MSGLKPAELALLDFQYFTEKYLGLKLWECQRKWQDRVQAAVDGEYRGLCLMAPADHGKTSRVVVPLILWLLARNRASRIILVGNTDSYAEQIGRAVTARIERTPILAKEFGLAKGTKWTASEIHIERPNWQEKDPSLLCIGVGAEVQSQRADYIICDDLATRRNSRTEGQRQQIKSYFFTDLMSRLDKTNALGNKIFVFGHRVDANDLYSDIESKENWVHVKDKAIVDDTEKKILCPEGHTYESLSIQRADDPVGFALLFQQQSVAGGKFVTRTSVEKCRRPDLRFHQSLTPEVRGQFSMTWMSLDPAFSTERWAAYSVLTVWGMRPNGIRTLLYGHRERMSPEHLLNFIEMKFRLMGTDYFAIEANQGQTLLLTQMRRKFPEKSSKFKQVFTTSKNGSLEADILKMFDLFSADNPKVELPYATPTEQAFVHSLEEELVGYPDFRYKDMIMSMYIGEKGLGLIKEEKRSGYMLPRGIIGAVASNRRIY